MLQQTNGYSSGRSDHLLTLQGALTSPEAVVNILNNITTLKLVKKAKRSEYEDDRSECLDKLYKANYPQHSATTCWQIINETQIICGKMQRKSCCLLKIGVNKTKSRVKLCSNMT